MSSSATRVSLHSAQDEVMTKFSLELQVIFPALDIRVKNVAQTYSLEHEGESNLFDQLFNLLNNVARMDENFPRELASCTGALQTSISQHLAKEEEQVCSLHSLFNGMDYTSSICCKKACNFIT